MEEQRIEEYAESAESICNMRYIDVVTVPLMMAYVTRYIFGTDKLRPNAFEVRGLSGTSTGIIHCSDSANLYRWLKYITDNIVGLTHLQVNGPFSFCLLKTIKIVSLSHRHCFNLNDVHFR